MLAASMVKVAEVSLPPASVSPAPSNFEKRPRTVEIAMCFTEKPTWVWVVSSFHCMVPPPVRMNVPGILPGRVRVRHGPGGSRRRSACPPAEYYLIIEYLITEILSETSGAVKPPSNRWCGHLPLAVTCRPQAQALQQRRGFLLLGRRQPRHRLANGRRVRREDLLHQRRARTGERGVARPPVGGAQLPLHIPALDQLVHQEGDPAARHEDLPLHLAQQQRTLVVQRFHDGKLGDRDAVLLEVRLRPLGNGALRPREHHIQLERRCGGRIGRLGRAGGRVGRFHLSTKITRPRRGWPVGGAGRGAHAWWLTSGMPAAPHPLPPGRPAVPPRAARACAGSSPSRAARAAR